MLVCESFLLNEHGKGKLFASDGPRYVSYHFPSPPKNFIRICSSLSKHWLTDLMRSGGRFLSPPGHISSQRSKSQNFFVFQDQCRWFLSNENKYNIGKCHFMSLSTKLPFIKTFCPLIFLCVLFLQSFYDSAHVVNFLAGSNFLHYCHNSYIKVI